MASSASPLRLEQIYDIQNRIALVTGGGTGIGLMIAQGLAANGAKVYITGRRKEVLEKVAHGFVKGSGSGDIIPIVMDVTDKESISNAQKEIQTREGRLHILVNNAGIEGPTSKFFNDTSAPQHKDAETIGRAMFDNESFDAWTDVYRSNTFSVYFVTMAFVGLLAKGSADTKGYTSCVVNITSISGIIKVAQNHFGYNSAKAAASHLTKMLATEFALKRIPVRVCAVAPGVYESEMTKARIPDDTVDQTGLGIVSIPVQRAGTAQEVSGAVIYLVSPAGCFTNGKEIIIDGGYTTVNPATV